MITELMQLSQSSDVNSDVVQRLKAAVKRGGGNKAVAARSGIKLGSLNNYLRSVHRLPADAATKVASACDVSIDWLLRGDGPMVPAPRYPTRADLEALEGQPDPPEPLKRSPLFGMVDIKRMAEAIKISDDEFAIRGMHPSPRRKAQIYLQIYDAFSVSSPEKVREILRIWHMEDLGEGDDL